MHRQVQLALNPRVIGDHLARAFPSGQHVAEVRVLDMKYEVGEYCTILYQLGGRMVIGAFHWGHAESELPASARLIEPLGMQVYSFEQDPALPGLATAMDPRRVRAALAEALPLLADDLSILLLGYYEELRVPYMPLFLKQVRLLTAREWAPGDLVRCHDLLAAGALDVAGLLTHTLPIAQVEQAYATALNDPECLKLVLEWDDNWELRMAKGEWRIG